VRISGLGGFLTIIFSSPEDTLVALMTPFSLIRSWTSAPPDSIRAFVSVPEVEIHLAGFLGNFSLGVLGVFTLGSVFLSFFGFFLIGLTVPSPSSASSLRLGRPRGSFPFGVRVALPLDDLGVSRVFLGFFCLDSVSGVAGVLLLISDLFRFGVTTTVGGRSTGKVGLVGFRSGKIPMNL